MKVEAIVGVDFDNTIVDYDELMHEIALEKGFISPGVYKSKIQIRESVRRLETGELKWRMVQAEAYGPRILKAKLIKGVDGFLRRWKKTGFQIYIVSHKTEFASQDSTETNLRAAAMGWMKRQGFFNGGDFGINEDIVYFESNRREKVERIKRLGCTHFIDDLVETFQEDCFPPQVEKILFSPVKPKKILSNLHVLASWKEISNYFFGEGD